MTTTIELLNHYKQLVDDQAKEIITLRIALSLADHEYNHLREKCLSFPPLNNVGRWTYEAIN